MGEIKIFNSVWFWFGPRLRKELQLFLLGNPAYFDRCYTELVEVLNPPRFFHLFDSPADTADFRRSNFFILVLARFFRGFLIFEIIKSIDIKSVTLYLLGLATGIVGCFLFCVYFPTSTQYVELLTDYNIDGVGYLRKGTKLRIDKGMPEGLTRYILYLNLKGGETKLLNKKSSIIPYWLKDKSEVQQTRE